MLALITHLDGANAMLFHVEHCGNRKWAYQCRWPASRVPDYREWSPVRRTSGERAIEPLSDPTVLVEVRWCWLDGFEMEDDAPPWVEPCHDAVPHEWGSATADFHVIVKQPRDFAADPILHVAAMVRGIPSAWSLEMPRRAVAQEGYETFTIPGTAMGCGPGCVLRGPAEFATANDAYAISNAGASQVTLLPVDARLPSVLPFRGSVAVKVGRLSAAEIELLKLHVSQEQATKEAAGA